MFRTISLFELNLLHLIKPLNIMLNSVTQIIPLFLTISVEIHLATAGTLRFSCADVVCLTL